jgi:hypothetical protein
MKIIDKINAAIEENRTMFSFEYFPPKTDEGSRYKDLYLFIYIFFLYHGKSPSWREPDPLLAPRKEMSACDFCYFFCVC